MNIFNCYGVPVTLNTDQDFLKVRETLTRIGIASFNPEKTGPKGKSLIQSCHIFHKQGQYAIVHFKELFKLDGKDKFVTEGGEVRETIITEDDIARRNTIALLLEDWGLLKILEPDKIKDITCPMAKIKIISHKEKNDWDLIAKHSLGKRKKKQ